MHKKCGHPDRSCAILDGVFDLVSPELEWFATKVLDDVGQYQTGIQPKAGLSIRNLCINTSKVLFDRSSAPKWFATESTE
jgi:hypothetical protein